LSVTNAWAVSVSLNGYGLSDSTNTPLKFAFPSTAVLRGQQPAAGLVRCRTNAPGYHALSFSLGARENWSPCISEPPPLPAGGFSDVLGRN